MSHVTIITKSDLIAEAAKDRGFCVKSTKGELQPKEQRPRDLRFCEAPCYGRIMRNLSTGERYCKECRKSHPALALSYRPPSY